VCARGLLAAGVAVGCTPARHLSTTPPDRSGLELHWQQPIATPDGDSDAPWLAIGKAGAFLAGPAVGVMAFDLAGAGDGALLWSSSHVSVVPPVAVGEIVLTATDKALVAVRQDRDDVAWRVDLDATPKRLFLIGDHVGVATDHEARTFDSHGTPAWRLSLEATPSTPFVTDSDLTFVGVGSNALLAIDSATGTIRWRIPLPATPETLAAAGTRLYVSTVNGHLYSFEKTASPKPKWDWDKIRVIGQPVVDDRSVYFTLLNNILYAFDRGGGSERWHVALPARPVTGPLLLGDAIAVPLADGRVMEIRPDGHVRRPAAPPNLPAALALQSAGATSERNGVATVTTTQDQKRLLMMWGAPKPGGGSR